jgi:hypothetical protein
MSYSFDKLCNSARLKQEIENSTITVALDYINTTTSPENTTIFFKAELALGEETTLEELVENHTNIPLPDQEVIFTLDTPKDTDGSPLQRIKVTATGWSYQLHGVEFKTSQLSSIHSKKADGTDFGFANIKCYDSDNDLIETQELADTDCVKTVIDWEPTHDYEIVGGMFKLASLPEVDVRLWVIGVPDVPVEYGGSKEFVTSVNIKYIGLEEGVRADGRASKYLAHNAQYHTNKMRLVLKHPAGYKQDFQMIFEIFKA